MFEIDFTTDLYIKDDIPNIEKNEIINKLDQEYNKIDMILSTDYENFINNKSTNTNRRYITIASRISMLMLSALNGYIDGHNCNFIKIVQIGIDYKYQKLGLCKKLLNYMINKLKNNNYWKYLVIECVNNDYLYKYLLNSNEWKLMNISDRNFYCLI